jgi:hypothetical protein
VNYDPMPHVNDQPAFDFASFAHSVQQVRLAIGCLARRLLRARRPPCCRPPDRQTTLTKR